MAKRTSRFPKSYAGNPVTVFMDIHFSVYRRHRRLLENVRRPPETRRISAQGNSRIRFDTVASQMSLRISKHRSARQSCHV